MDFIV